MDVELPEKPTCDRGLWTRNANQKPLCGNCDHARASVHGGMTCSWDPLRLTITGSCRGFGFVPGVEELWE